MKKFKLYNNIAGWIVFIVASTTFLLTIEPTASFWDCGEFIATSFKLEVGHPPGAPLFMILARFFSLFTSDISHVAKMINSLSALASGFTILFLFWTITHLTVKLFNTTKLTISQIIVILGSGIVGSLAYAFSDTFWFSAVEGEVYATSSLFTALVFWAILKWENVANEEYANRWLIFIAYLMGLSIGVHLLNLLAIPAIVFIYYFKKYKVSRNGIIKTSLLAILILGTVQYIIIPGVIKVASWFELLFVNGFGFPYNSGVFFFTVMLIFLIVYGLLYSVKKQKVLLNTIILMFSVILIGYSSFAMIVIRSKADPPMDENNPENIFSLLSYLNREQYGDRPLLVGQYYNSPLDSKKPYKKGIKTYTPINGKYKVTNQKDVPNYDSRFTTFFPRMYSSENRHIKAYKQWANITGRKIRYRDGSGEQKTIVMPTFIENLKFFFKYQVGHMYFRYFMWNFSGRQNDIQGHGSILNGNWITGINFIDNYLIGNTEKMPESFKHNKTRNVYYMFPLILGLIGLFYHQKKDIKQFWVVLLLFLFTGLAIVVYLNQYPYQPRERDYAYAGSFYAFSIWIGLGVAAIYNSLHKKVNSLALSISIAIVCFLLVPVLMANENWDDHDRSNRYTTRDFASNYLNSCAPNAILFTNGDNDTFPLWYAQEVEGIRTDVRVVNLSLLNTDWYIGQIKRKAYDSDPVPISLKEDKYIQGTRDIIYIYERIKDTIELQDAITFIASDNTNTKLRPGNGQEFDYLPVKNLKLTIDSENVIRKGVVSENDRNKIVSQMQWKLNRSYILKNDLMVLDLLANNNWKRPIYFAVTVGSKNYLNLEKYFQLEGLAYRVVPIKSNTQNGEIGRIDTKIMYNNMMNKFKWGGINNPNVFLDNTNMRMIMNFRSNLARLANALLSENKKDSAITVLDRCVQLMPDSLIPVNYFSIPIAEAYYKAGERDKADNLVEKINVKSTEKLNYYFSFTKNQIKLIDLDIRREMSVLNELIRICDQYQNNEQSENIKSKLGELYMKYNENLK
ncbi:MAG: DUF2723 domain-containing protein [Chlorobi bacterium]|nr:DUF2723 domain-containing protein [Chlorobiota bacterium]